MRLDFPQHVNYVHIVTMGAVKPVTHSSKDRVVWITPKICGLVQKFGKKGMIKS